MSEQKFDKKKRKDPVRFGVTLNEEQKEAKRLSMSHDIVTITGEAGSGKSLLATHIALDLLINSYGPNSYNKIIILRPVVFPDEEIGFLKGGIEDKLAPIMRPVLDNFDRLMDSQSKKTNLKKLIDDKTIEIIPIAYSKGLTYLNTVVIVDEAEDMTVGQMELILTRAGKGSKILITGDLHQQDLKGKSGMELLEKVSGRVSSMCLIKLKENHRAGVVKEIIEAIKIIKKEEEAQTKA